MSLLFLPVSLPMPCSHLHTCPFCSRLSLASMYLQSPGALAFMGGDTVRGREYVKKSFFIPMCEYICLFSSHGLSVLGAKSKGFLQVV